MNTGIGVLGDRFPRMCIHITKCPLLHYDVFSFQVSPHFAGVIEESQPFSLVLSVTIWFLWLVVLWFCGLPANPFILSEAQCPGSIPRLFLSDRICSVAQCTLTVCAMGFLGSKFSASFSRIFFHLCRRFFYQLMPTLFFMEDELLSGKNIKPFSPQTLSLFVKIGPSPLNIPVQSTFE